MARSVVITGIGLVTPLGQYPREILERIRRGEVAASKPSFDVARWPVHFVPLSLTLMPSSIFA